mgnify:CR=1 FL=1
MWVSLYIVSYKFVMYEGMNVFVFEYEYTHIYKYVRASCMHACVIVFVYA